MKRPAGSPVRAVETEGEKGEEGEPWPTSFPCPVLPVPPLRGGQGGTKRVGPVKRTPGGVGGNVRSRWPVCLVRLSLLASGDPSAFLFSSNMSTNVLGRIASG